MLIITREQFDALAAKGLRPFNHAGAMSLPSSSLRRATRPTASPS